MSNPSHRHPKNDYLQHLIDYFRRVSDLWEGPDGCGTLGTTQCTHIITHLKILQNERMALGLTHLPPVDDYAPKIPAFGVSIPSSAVNEFVIDAVVALAATSMASGEEEDIYDAVGKFREAHPEKVDNPTNIAELKLCIMAATIRNQIELRQTIKKLFEQLTTYNARHDVATLDESAE